jgi:hypothetical protein
MFEAGHMGIRKTINQVLTKLCKCAQILKNYVKSCHVCQTVSMTLWNQPDIWVWRTSWRHHTIFIDLLDPFEEWRQPTSVGLQDELSKWVEFFSQWGPQPRMLQGFENEVFCRFGVSEHRFRTTDRNLNRSYWEKLCNDWKIRHAFTSIYHPSNQAEAEQNVNSDDTCICWRKSSLGWKFTERIA